MHSRNNQICGRPCFWFYILVKTTRVKEIAGMVVQFDLLIRCKVSHNLVLPLVDQQIDCFASVVVVAVTDGTMF